MAVVFDNINQHRFVFADNFGHNEPPAPHIVILSDIGYWNDHYDELKIWCDRYGCKVQGMIVEIYNDQIANLFCLRWS